MRQHVQIQCHWHCSFDQVRSKHDTHMQVRLFLRQARQRCDIFPLISELISVSKEGQPAFNQTLVCFMRGVNRLITANPRHKLINSQTWALMKLRNTLPFALHISQSLSLRQPPDWWTSAVHQRSEIDHSHLIRPWDCHHFLYFNLWKKC